MIQRVASIAGGRAPRWWARFAALAGSCMLIVVLAAPAAHAQAAPSGIDAVMDGESERPSAWERDERIDPDRYALTMPIGYDPAEDVLRVTDDDVVEHALRTGDKVMYVIAAGFHDFGNVLMRLSLWLFELAFSFAVIEAIGDAVAALSTKLQNTYVAGIGLDKFAVFLAVFYCGIQLLRRRTAHSLGELAASMTIAVAGAALVANPLAPLNAMALTVRSISVAMMDLASDTPDPPPLADRSYTVPKEMSDQLYDSMIVEPYEIANWGRLLNGKCKEQHDAVLRGDIVSTGEYDEDSKPENFLVRKVAQAGEKECRDAAVYNTSMNWDRVGVAFLTFLVRLVLFVFNGALAGSVIGGQFLLGQVVVALPLAVVFGTVPGTGRQIALKVGNAAGQASAAVILAGFLLTVLVEFQTALLELPGKSLLTRYTLVLVMVFMLWRYRGPLRDMINEIILHFSQRLKTRSPGNIAPNLLEDRELWENSVWKRVKERMVDSSYDSTKKFPRKLVGLRKRPKPGAGGGTTHPSPDGPRTGRDTRRPSRRRGTPTYDDGFVARTAAGQYAHDVTQSMKRYGRKWKGHGQAVVAATKKTASVTGKGAQQLATLSGTGFRGGLKLSRKGLVSAAGVAGALRNPETIGDAAGIVGNTPVAGAKAVARGAKRARGAAHYAHIYGGILAGDAIRGAKKGRDAVEVGVIRASMAGSAVSNRLETAARRLGNDMSLSHAYRAHQTQSAIPGAAKRDAQRRDRNTQREAKSRDKDVRKGHFLP